MRGHLPLIALRRHGKRPAIAWISTDPDAMKTWRDWHSIRPAHACIQVDADDNPTRLDLRCIVGMTVSVTGSDAERVEAVAEACRQHEAARVIAVVIGPGPHHDVATITDTNGAIAWPQ